MVMAICMPYILYTYIYVFVYDVYSWLSTEKKELDRGEAVKGKPEKINLTWNIFVNYYISYIVCSAHIHKVDYAYIKN